MFPFKAFLISALSLSAVASPLALQSNDRQLQARSRKYWPYQSYVSEPNLHPPQFSIEKSGAPLAEGLLFFAPGSANESAPEQPKQTSPMIMTDTGDLVWSAKNGTFGSTFTTSSLNGQEVLTYWSGIELEGANVGHFYGEVTILDTSYNTLYNFCPKLDLHTPPDVHAKCQLDGHEQHVSNEGTILFTAYNITQTDLSSLGGPKDGYVWDCLFFVYDVATETELFRWSSLDHVPVSATHEPFMTGAGQNDSNAFDYFHINSVQAIGKDYFLVNGRHTFSTYLVNNDKKGDIVWTIEGTKGGDFGKLPAGGKFRWQHDVRIVIPEHDPTFDPTKDSFIYYMFNNDNAYQSQAYQLNLTQPSNGLVMRLTPPCHGKSGKAEFISADADPSDPQYSIAQGSNQPLHNGNRLLCFGFEPTVKEFGPDGDTRMTLRYGEDNDVQSYRMFRRNWVGRPATKPALAVQDGKGYVSWNGATEVTNYAVYTGASKNALTKTKMVKKTGFETSFGVAGSTKYVLVEAYEGKMAVKNSTVVKVM